MSLEQEYIYSGLCFDFKEWRDIEKREGSQDGMLYILGDTKYRFSCKEYEVTFPSNQHVSLESETPRYEELSSVHDYGQGFSESAPPAGGPVETAISLVNADAIDTALVLSDPQGEALRPALLNMASPTNPGGKYNIGEKAQEEMIFYRSNMWAYLDPDGTSGLSFCEAKFPNYPLPDVGGLYTPGVTFIRGSEADKFRLIKPRKIDIVSVPSIKFPKLVDGEYSASDRERMFNKIRAILSIAREHGNDAVVLSAFGCGMFRNPPESVSVLFEEVIREHFAGVFKRIVFAIKCVDGKVSNYDAFARVFPVDKELEKKICLFPQPSMKFGEPAAWGSAAESVAFYVHWD